MHPIRSHVPRAASTVPAKHAPATTCRDIAIDWCGSDTADAPLGPILAPRGRTISPADLQQGTVPEYLAAVSGGIPCTERSDRSPAWTAPGHMPAPSPERSGPTGRPANAMRARCRRGRSVPRADGPDKICRARHTGAEGFEPGAPTAVSPECACPHTRTCVPPAHLTSSVIAGPTRVPGGACGCRASPRCRRG